MTKLIYLKMYVAKHVSDIFKVWLRVGMVFEFFNVQVE